LFLVVVVDREPELRLNLARKHEAIVNRRRDWFRKSAHQLTDQVDVLCFETLNFKGMQRLWGRRSILPSTLIFWFEEPEAAVSYA
jgi:transposase